MTPARAAAVGNVTSEIIVKGTSPDGCKKRFRAGATSDAPENQSSATAARHTPTTTIDQIQQQLQACAFGVWGPARYPPPGTSKSRKHPRTAATVPIATHASDKIDAHTGECLLTVPESSARISASPIASQATCPSTGEIRHGALRDGHCGPYMTGMKSPCDAVQPPPISPLGRAYGRIGGPGAPPAVESAVWQETVDCSELLRGL